MMNRRKYLAAVGAGTSLGLAGCSGETGGNNSSGGNGSGGSGNSDESTEGASGGEATEMESGGDSTDAGSEATESSNGEEEATEGETEAETDTEASDNSEAASTGGGFGPETFTGSGTSTEEGIELAAGPVTAEYSHSGSGNFIVNLVALEGESYQDVLLANIIGQAEGSQVAAASANGQYNLNIEADGEWEITVEQPSNPEPESPPIEADGEGPSYIGPFDFSGPTTFQGSHDGESNFIVTPIPVDPSNLMASVFNEIGQFEGETTARVNGIAYLNVTADGSWTLSTQG